MAQEIETHSLKDLELTVSRVPTYCSQRPTQLKRGIKHPVGEQATTGWKEVTSLGGGFRTPGLLEEPYPHHRPIQPSSDRGEIERADYPRGRGRHVLH